MRNITKLFFTVLFLTGIVFIGCDDNGSTSFSGPSGPSVIGKWLKTGVTFDGVAQEDFLEFFYLFNADGSGQMLNEDESLYSDLQWSILGTSITITLEGGDPEEKDFTVTETTLTITDSVNVVVVETFTRQVENGNGATTIPYGYYGIWEHCAQIVGDYDIEIFNAPIIFTLEQDGDWVYDYGGVEFRRGTSTWEVVSGDTTGSVYKLTMTVTEAVNEEDIDVVKEMILEDHQPGDYAFFDQEENGSTVRMLMIMQSDNDIKFAGLVQDDGELLGQVHVEGYHPATGNDWDDYTHSRVTGFFFGSDINAGAWNIEATHDYYEDWETTVEASLGDVVFLNIDMSGGGAGSAYVFGTVFDYDTGLPIDGVYVTSSDGSSAVTESSGFYSMNVGTGYITFTASKSGYEVGQESYDLSDGDEWNLNFYLEPSGGGSGEGVVYGIVTDSQTGEPVDYASVISDDGKSTLTGSYGEYELTVNEGYRYFLVSKDGYYSSASERNVEDGVRHELNFVLSPEMGSEGQLRFVLSWGAYPEDLDSYIRTPDIEDSVYTVSYWSRGSADLPPYITLDLDDVDGYGPETITVYELYPGTYHYWVNDYDETGDLPGCGAVVNIFDETGQIYNLTVPSLGEGNYWHVCKINGSNGEITIVNTIQSYAPEFMSGELPRKPR